MVRERSTGLRPPFIPMKMKTAARLVRITWPLELEEIAITGTSEVHQAAQVLATLRIQALWITGDNTALQAFSAIGKVAEDSDCPW